MLDGIVEVPANWSSYHHYKDIMGLPVLILCYGFVSLNGCTCVAVLPVLILCMTLSPVWVYFDEASNVL